MVVGEFTEEADFLIIGGGPAGYTAAFRAARRGVKVTIVEDHPHLGGVCLRAGCIPSKALLHVAGLLVDMRRAERLGIKVPRPAVQLEQIREHVAQVVARLARGLESLVRKYRVERIHGRARFEDNRHVAVTGDSLRRLRFRQALVATGSVAATLPGLAGNERIWDPARALALPEVPPSLVVAGGGYEALELAQIYAALGSRVTLAAPGPLLPEADRDLVRPLEKRLREQLAGVHVGVQVDAVEEADGGLRVVLEGRKGPATIACSRLLLALASRPNTADLGLEKTQARLDSGGFVVVNRERRTADPKIYAAGDVVEGPPLAHKAMHEGKIVGDVVSGRPNFYEPRAVPWAVFTEPQVAWAGLTEAQAAAAGRPVAVRKVSWVASGRALGMGRTEGFTKLVLDPESGAVLGVGLCGAHATELVGEAVLAVEAGATAEDLDELIHPHPTLVETLGDAAGDFLPEEG